MFPSPRRQNRPPQTIPPLHISPGSGEHTIRHTLCTSPAYNSDKRTRRQKISSIVMMFLSPTPPDMISSFCSKFTARFCRQATRIAARKATTIGHYKIPSEFSSRIQIKYQVRDTAQEIRRSATERSHFLLFSISVFLFFSHFASFLLLFFLLSHFKHSEKVL